MLTSPRINLNTEAQGALNLEAWIFCKSFRLFLSKYILSSRKARNKSNDRKLDNDFRKSLICICLELKKTQEAGKTKFLSKENVGSHGRPPGGEVWVRN